VAIDGVDGAGKSVLADELATRLMAAGRPAVRASVDSFHRPQADRYRLGRTSPEGFYRDSYNYQRLTEFLLVPFAPGGSGQFRVAGFDYKTDTPVSPPKQHAARRAVLILDGIFLHRPELRARWDFSIFLHVGFDVSVARCAQRDGSDPGPDAASNRRDVAGQRLYLLEARPWEHASVIIDNTDLRRPPSSLPTSSEELRSDGGRQGSADGLSLQAVSGELLVLDVETEHRDQCAGQEHARRDPERQ
jgi:uridine kinase